MSRHRDPSIVATLGRVLVCAQDLAWFIVQRLPAPAVHPPSAIRDHDVVEPPAFVVSRAVL